MKRSAINEILGHTRQFFSQHDVHLPPFASFPPTQWRKLDAAAWSEVCPVSAAQDRSGSSCFKGWEFTVSRTCNDGCPRTAEECGRAV